jgi:hypothetical protein
MVKEIDEGHVQLQCLCMSFFFFFYFKRNLYCSLLEHITYGQYGFS